MDEAYAEYADYSVVPLIKKYENLIVLRTFSKAFSLAGLRLGYAVANPTLAKALDKTPAPYPVNVVSLSMGRKMLENIEIMRKVVAALKAGAGKTHKPTKPNKRRRSVRFEGKLCAVQHRKALRGSLRERPAKGLSHQEAWANCSSTRIACEPQWVCPK